MSDKNKPYKITKTVKSDDIPSWSTRGIYDPIVKAAATLGAGEALEIKLEKMTQVSAIRKKISASFEHNKYKVRQRQRKNGDFCYIERTK